MKKVMLAVVLVVAVVVLLFGVVLVLTESKREKIAERWRTLESDEALAAKFPEIREANGAATKLETAAIPLGIVLTPRAGVEQQGESIIDTKAFDAFKKASGDWESAIIESAGDGIAPIPPEVAAYLGDHRAEIDAITSILTTDGTPRWPVLVDGPAALRPIPNLLGQMNLGRALAAASFEAQLAGDRDRAWRFEQAQWTVAKGLLSRPEMMSQLIGIALSRRVAGVARKLDGPAPPWFEEMERFDFHRAMLDACRSESAASSEAMFDDAFLEELRASAQSGNANLFGIVRDLATRPFISWGVTEMESVVVEELLRLEKAEPCAIDSRAISASIETKLPLLARRLGGDFLPSTHTALSRAASVEIAIEGSSKVAALKARRASAPDRAWPAAADDLASSRCSDARWNYARSADGAIQFTFDGKVDRPPAYYGYWVPLEFRGAP